MLATGMSVTKVARKLSVSRGSVQRWKAEASASAGDTNGHVNGVDPDWRGLRNEAVAGLQRGVEAGRATSSVALSRLAQAELDSHPCSDHVEADEVRRVIGELLDTTSNALKQAIPSEFGKRIQDDEARLALHEVLGLAGDRLTLSWRLTVNGTKETTK